jgi:hypothetical protein
VDRLNCRGAAGGSVPRLLERHGFERIETGQLVDTYARSAFVDTRGKAQRVGDRGTTLNAYKPST